MFLLKVIDALARHRLKYAVVGGYAVALHGAARGTVDVDLVINIDKKSLEDAEAALEEIGLQSRQPVTANDVFQFREEYIRNRNMKAWGFINPSNPTEMVDIVITEDLSDLSTVTKKIGNKKIKVVALPELIRMKRESGRPQDLEDVKALEKIL